MYLDLLRPHDTTFETSINRMFPRYRSPRLAAVVLAVQAAQNNLTMNTAAAVASAMIKWRQQDPNEFANRGQTNGVGYRLWMEVKQLIRNRWGQQIGMADPPKLGAPGDVLLNVYVPADPGHFEICHGFAYRWAIAAGKIAENPLLSAMNGPFNAGNVTPVLYPNGAAGYPAARVGGVVQLQAGDIVAMFVNLGHGNYTLGHSLIAETATTWFSANNTGTFGVGVGRVRVDTTQNFGVFMGNQVGWVGNGNQWMRPDGQVVEVVYRR